MDQYGMFSETSRAFMFAQKDVGGKRLFVDAKKGKRRPQKDVARAFTVGKITEHAH